MFINLENREPPHCLCSSTNEIESVTTKWRAGKPSVSPRADSWVVLFRASPHWRRVFGFGQPGRSNWVHIIFHLCGLDHLMSIYWLYSSSSFQDSSKDDINALQHDKTQQFQIHSCHKYTSGAIRLFTLAPDVTTQWSSKGRVTQPTQTSTSNCLRRSAPKIATNVCGKKHISL